MLKLCADFRVAGCPRYYLGDGSPLMFVPPVIRTCVAFLGYNSKALGVFRLAGTTFMVAYEVTENFAIAHYLVTARHVIEAASANSADKKIIVRINRKHADFFAMDTRCSDWIFHPSDPLIDVAALPFESWPEGFDHAFLGQGAFAVGDVLRRANIGVGEEIFLTGLFTAHRGTKRNIPIVRVGNIAAMPEEPVQTKNGKIDAYLVETRSLGGLSGSTKGKMGKMEGANFAGGGV